MKLRMFCAVLLTFVMSAASRADNRNVYPIPEERGTAGTLTALEALPIHARVLYLIAHPDDEGAGTLTWLARKAHAHTALFSLTRGDGGQNVLGTEKYEAMGLVRTGELLEACRIYGVEPYFSTVFEFGFSKSAGSRSRNGGTRPRLKKWSDSSAGGARRFVISRFTGTARDGHGHHQAAGILSAEAFRAAGDPKRFPQHIEAGLQAWQPRKLYESGRGGSGGVRIPVGDYDPVLGRSYRQIGAEGYSKHRSQGNGAGFALPAPSYDSLKLVESVPPGNGHDEQLFDGVDTSLSSILELVGERRAAWVPLEPDIREAQRAADEALRLFDPRHPEKSAPAAAQGALSLARALNRLGKIPLPQGGRDIVADALRVKLHDFHEAVNATLGVYLVATVEEPTAFPGQKVAVTATLFDRGTVAVSLQQLRIVAPGGWAAASDQKGPSPLGAGGTAQRRFSTEIPPDARPTEPFWYRENRNETRYHTRPTPDVFAPFDPPALTAVAEYEFRGAEIQIDVPVRAEAGDPIRGADLVDFQVVPLLSVAFKPEIAIVPSSPAPQTREFQVSMLGNAAAGVKGNARLEIPKGWSVEPREAPFATSRKGESVTVRFRVRIPAAIRPGNYAVSAVAEAAGQEFRRGYRVVSYPENWTRNLYGPATGTVEIFDLKVAPRLTVGYVMGAGDEVPQALEQMVRVLTLSADDLAYGDLSRFSAIVVGIRAYNINEDLKTHYQRLLRYVEQGGTLIVQYNTPRGASSPFPYGPYPMTLSAADRITVEDSPVRILEPQSPVFNVPNKITDADFQGWVQERGLYFLSQWDPRYTALLSGNDPGEPAKNGGMLLTRYGKGCYIYTAYAWFRELPGRRPRGVSAVREHAELRPLRMLQASHTITGPARACFGQPG